MYVYTVALLDKSADIDYTKDIAILEDIQRILQPIVSRGKTGAPKSSLNTNALSKHLQNYHKDKYDEYQAAEAQAKDSKKHMRMVDSTK